MPDIQFKMTHNEAKSLMSAATASAAHHKVPGAIAIVDNGSNLILLESLDNTMSAAANIAIGKAATAAAFKRPTKDIEKVILEGRTPMLVAKSSMYVPLKGGYPLWHNDQLVGAVAIAGTLDADMDEVVVLDAIQNKGW